MTDAIYKQVLDNVQTILRGLTLSRLEDAEIVISKIPYDNNLVRRGITISWDEERIDDSDSTEGTNERDMVRYPCVLTLCDGTGRGWDDGMANIADWRQKIRRAFHNKRALTSVSDTGVLTVICLVTHEKPTIPQEYLKNRCVSQMTIWACYLEPRT